MTRRWITLAFILLAAGLAPGMAQAQGAEGAKVYNDNCARCHQPRAPWEFTDRAWDVIIHHMHVRGYLTEPERKAVLRYLQENNYRAAFVPARPAVAGAEAPDGKALVAKLGCQGCHVVGGAGGNIGPSLDTVYQRRDKEYVMRKLSEPTFDNRVSVMPYFGLSDEQKKAIAEYLASVGKQ